MKRLVLDIDGVIADSVAGILDYVWDRYHVPMLPDDVDSYLVEKPIWNHIKDHPEAPKHKGDLAHEISRIFFRNPTYMGSVQPYWPIWARIVKNIVKASEFNVDVWFLTSRKAHLRTVTKAWLERWFSGIPMVRLIHSNGSAHKKHHVRELSEHHNLEKLLFVDDKGETIEEICELGIPKVLCLQPERPYNKSFVHKFGLYGDDAATGKFINSFITE